MKSATDKTAGRERIAKRLAAAGVCSRRQAEAMIAEGRVSLNGHVLDTPACLVGPDDDIRVDGKAVGAKQRPRLYLFHKPRGVLVSRSDPQGRPVFYDLLPDDMPRVMSVGRLDYMSEGLLLLTTDGGLARALEHPSQGWSRKYRVRVHKSPDPGKLAALANGITIDGIRYKSVEAVAEPVKPGAANVWLEITLREGKNREIRKIMEFLGHPVSRLIRISFGPFQLGTIKPSGLKPVPADTMRAQLGGLITSASD